MPHQLILGLALASGGVLTLGVFLAVVGLFERQTRSLGLILAAAGGAGALGLGMAQGMWLAGLICVASGALFLFLLFIQSGGGF